MNCRLAWIESLAGKLIIHAVEEVLLVSLVVHHDEFRRIEEAAGIQAVGGDEISPVLAAVAEVEAHIGVPKAAVFGGQAAVRRGHSLAGARGYVDDQACLAAVLGRRRAGNHLHRLDRIQRNLVGEDLALLIGDRLAIHGERVFGVIAQSVEEAVGIGGNPRRGERNQRTDRRGCALQRQLVDQVAVHVGVEGGRVLQQVLARRFHVDRRPRSSPPEGGCSG